jgi:hypothetical protein
VSGALFQLFGFDGGRHMVAHGAPAAIPSDLGGRKAPGGPVMGREAELLGRRGNFHGKIKLGCQGFWAKLKN